MSENGTPQLKVSPMSVSFDLKNSQTEEGTLTITNAADFTMEYKVYVEPYYVDKDYNPVFTIENNYTKLSHWISFEGDDETFSDTYDSKLAAGASKILKYKISMPEDAERFSQYAIVFIETEDPNMESSTGVLVKSRIGITFTGRTSVIKLASGDTASSMEDMVAGEINDVNFDKFILGGNMKIGADIENPNAVALDAVEKVTVRNMFGSELYNVENIVEVMPETTRNIEVEWETTPVVGILNVDYTISAGGNETSGSQIVLKIPAAILILIIAVFVVAIISTTRMLRAHKRATGKYFSFNFRSSRASRQRRRNRRSRIHLPKIRRSRDQKKDSGQ